MQSSLFFEPWERIWKLWVPPKCAFFMWLAAHNRCWTSDRLERTNLPHPEACVLCDQERETLYRLLVSCLFSCQFWFFFLSQMGLALLAPQPEATSFLDWWSSSSSSMRSSIQKGFNSLIILGAWTLWRHRNECVFGRKPPRLAAALCLAGDEILCWSAAGAKDLQLLEATAYRF